jgi:hypothetical protein
MSQEKMAPAQEISEGAPKIKHVFQKAAAVHIREAPTPRLTRNGLTLAAPRGKSFNEGTVFSGMCRGSIQLAWKMGQFDLSV